MQRSLQRPVFGQCGTNRARPQARGRAITTAVSAKLKVAVTGAGGRTGALVTKRLAAEPDKYEVRAVVRDDKSASKMAQLGVPPSGVYSADVSQGSPAAFAKAFGGADAVVIATSGVPVLKPLSMIPVIWAKITGGARVSPEFDWKGGQKPEQVDWLGQKAQVDAAKAAGVKHVVLISSMGGTEKDNNLNKLGDGNILLWKRKAEQYLIASGLTYTIIHPGGLIDDPASEREIMVGVDDALVKLPTRSIPRDDVARLAVACLSMEAAKNRSFDVVTKGKGDGQPTMDLEALLVGLKGNCDYSINSQMS